MDIDIPALKAEYKGGNVKIYGVYPGGMDTGFWSNDSATHIDSTSFMKPEDVAEEIVQIITNEKIYVSDITIDRP